MQRIFLLVIIVISISSCSSSEKRNNDNLCYNEYAYGFRTADHNNYTKLTVINPWEKANNISIEYYLFSKDAPVPDSLVNKNIIRTPVKRVICLSTTHLAYLDALDETDAVAGISGIKYISNTKIRKRFEKGDVPDVGYGQNLNYEVLVNQKPDIVLAYALGSEVTAYTKKLDELGIPVVIIAEYLEKTPLGKAEWIKVAGLLFDKEEESVIHFKKVEQQYLDLKHLATSATNKPRVLVGLPYKDVWWVPGGYSYMANLIADAGGNYLGKDNPSHESYIVSYEIALIWGNMADIWINTGNLTSKKEILLTDERFNNFRVLRDGEIYNNIKRLSPYGGNDFWESGTTNPHLVLRDLITIFHPELVSNNMIYYKKIK